jgi:hypothetical protein
MKKNGEFKFNQRIGGGDLADFTRTETITLTPWDEETPEERLKKQLDRIERGQAEIKAGIFIFTMIAALVYATIIITK